MIYFHHTARWLAIGAVAMMIPHARGAEPTDSLLAGYIAEAVAVHPALAAMQAMAQAESSRVRMASAWMNPELMLGVMSLPTSLNFREEPMTSVQIGFMQQIPFPGKLRNAHAAQEARAAAAAYQLEDMRLEVALRVTKAYYDLAGDLGVREALLRGKRLNDDLVAAARVMLASGMGSQTDLLKAQWESERWERRLIENDQRIASSRARLAAAVGRSNFEGWADPAPLNGSAPAPPQADFPDTLLEQTPMRLAERAGVQAQLAQVRRAELDYYPDPSVAFTYGIRGSLEAGADAMGASSSLSDLLSLEIRIPLPLFYQGNQKAALDENRAMLRGAEARYRSDGLQLQQEVLTAYEEFRAAYRAYELIRDDLLPRAEEIWKAALTDYQSNRIPFMTMNEALLEVVMQEMDLTMALAEVYKSKADLERWTGRNR
jgi:outer membrane protein TolC